MRLEIADVNTLAPNTSQVVDKYSQSKAEVIAAAKKRGVVRLVSVAEQRTLDQAKLPKPRALEKLYRGQINKLTELRFGSCFLPDNEIGCAHAVALLRMHEPPEDIWKIAPWISCGQLVKLQRRAHDLRLEHLGKLLRVTEAEREAVRLRYPRGGLWNLQPIDMSPQEVQHRAAERRKEKNTKDRRTKRDDERRKKQRAQERRAAMTSRPEVVLSLLDSGKWKAVPKLTKEAADYAAFQRFKPDELRRLVHRTLDRLVKDGEIRSKIEPSFPYGSSRVVCKITKNNLTYTVTP
jgi:hypothetical protein